MHLLLFFRAPWKSWQARIVSCAWLNNARPTGTVLLVRNRHKSSAPPRGRRVEFDWSKKPNICLLRQTCYLVCGLLPWIIFALTIPPNVASLLLHSFSPSRRLWSGPWCPLDGSGRSGVEGTKKICAYHTSLSSYWQESACSSVGERTCIQRGEERSGRNGDGIVGGGKKRRN